MNRRTAILVGSLIAVLAAAESIALSGLLAAERRDDRERYDRAITIQRRAAGHQARLVQSEREPMRSTLCVRGVETFATVLQRVMYRDIMTADKRLDVASLRDLSNRAVRAERYVEQASAGPALPQRMGRTRTLADEPQWRAIQPPRVMCDGDGNGDSNEAFALFRMDITPTAPARQP